MRVLVSFLSIHSVVGFVVVLMTTPCSSLLVNTGSFMLRSFCSHTHCGRISIPIPTQQLLKSILRRKGLVAGSKGISSFNNCEMNMVSANDDPALSTNIAVKENDSNENVLRILALHGKGESGPKFYSYLKPLLRQIETTINDSGQKNIRVECQCLTAPLEGGKWWEQIPMGSRSYKAKEYDGYETSHQTVLNELNGSYGYDVLLGHSQGAILITCMLADGSLQIQHRSESVLENVDGTVICPPLLVLNGVAWPKPFETEMVQFKTIKTKDDDLHQPVNALFVVAEDDPINPTEGALRVRDSLDDTLKIKTIMHPYSHSIPIQDETIVSNIVDWIVSNWKEE